MVSDCQPIPKTKKVPVSRKAPPCHEIALCLCGGRGENTYLWRNRFLVLMKKHFYLTSPHRGDLEDGYIVVRFSGFKEGCHEDEWLQCLLEEIGESPTKEDITKTAWMHLAEHTWSPYKSSYRAIAETDQDGPLRDGEIELLAPPFGLPRELWATDETYGTEFRDHVNEMWNSLP